jgi:glycosyltransferase involved in cell wall biosynthesis
MRVLFQLIGGDHGGGQAVAADLAAALQARGHEIGVLVPTAGPALAPFERLGARVHFAELGSLPRPWAAVRGARLLRHYDLLYSHTSVPGEIVGSAAAHLARRPQVVHRHNYLDLSPNKARRSAQLLLYRAALRGRVVIAVAEHVRAALEEHGADADRVVVIPNGTAIPAAAMSERPPGPLRIGLLGRLERQKGPDVFVRAAAGARLGQPAAWTIAGPSGPDPTFEARLRTEAAAAGVAILPPVDPGTDYLRSLDIVVVPSRWEGHPLVVLEALALGRPVIASDIPGIREIVGDAALLVPAEDERALAAAIHALADDEAHRAELGARGMAIARDRYDVRRTVERAVAVVEDAGLSRARRGRPA